jgi:seryl-tRNA synthetase
LSDFYVPRREGETEAVHACRWILARVCHDVDFAWYMVGTESLACAIRGLAEATGETEESLSASIDRQVIRLQKRKEPEVERLRERIESLEDRIADLKDDSAGSESEIQYLCAMGEIQDHLSFVRIGVCEIDIDLIERLTKLRFSKVRAG